MRYLKLLIAMAIAPAALLLSLHALGQARADTPATAAPRQLVSPPGNVEARDPVTVNLWLAPDFDEEKVWVDGTVSPGHAIGARDLRSGIYHLETLLPFHEVFSWRGHHYFGWWEGSQIIPGRRLTGTYELHLPGLNLQPDDKLNIGLISGIVPTVTFLHHAATHVTATPVVTPDSPTPVTTGTLAINLHFPPTATLGATPTTTLTGTYAFTGLATSPETGQFVVSPTVTLIADYVLPAPPPPPTTEIAPPTVTIPPLPFSYTLSARGDYSLVNLRHVSQPITLVVPFYPFQKALELNLTPLLVETTMSRTAFAVGGSTVRKLSGAETPGGYPLRYVQGGLLGQGQLRLRIPTTGDDPLRSSTALATAFRKVYRQEGLNRLLERSLDFPSFPITYSVGELNAYKETVIEIVTTEMSGTARRAASDLTLEAPFRLNVWHTHDTSSSASRRPRTLVFTPTATAASDRTRGEQLYTNDPCGWGTPDFDYASDIYAPYDFPDFNRCIGGKGDKQVLQMGLGRIILGPGDVLTLTIDSVAWVSLDPLPDELSDHWHQGLSGPERSGFTAIYRGPRTFWLNILYTPHPSLFTRQSVLMIRGLSRIWEYRLGQWWTTLVREPLRKERVFRTDLAAIGELNADRVSERWRRKFAEHQIQLSQAARIETHTTGEQWRIISGGEVYLIVPQNRSLNVYRQRRLSETQKKESRFSVFFTILLLLLVWIPYQWTTPTWDKEGSKKEEGAEKKRSLRSTIRNWQVTQRFLDWVKRIQTKVRQWAGVPAILDKLERLRCNRIVHLTLRFCLMLLFLTLGLMLENSWEGGILSPGSRPFAIALVCGALLLLRWEKALLMTLVGGGGVLLDIWLAGQYTSAVQNELAYSSATGTISGATSLAMLLVTLAWVSMLFWWGLSKASRFQLQHRDLHAFAFFGLAAAVFEVTDASLFALLVLFLAWFIFTLILDKAQPLTSKVQEKEAPLAQAQTPVQNPPPDVSDTQASPAPSEKLLGKSLEKPSREEPKTGLLNRLMVAFWYVLGRKTHEIENPARMDNDSPPSPDAPPSQPGQETPDADDTQKEAVSDENEAKEPDTSEELELLDDKLVKLWDPLAFGAILVATILLSRDPLLRTHLAPFAQSASPRNAWIVLLDPLARLATTLVPCLAIVLLMVILDTSIEHWRHLKTDQKSGKLDAYLKAIPLTCVLFAIFALGIGGLNLFTGTLELKLSDRIIYYVTIPLLTSIWVDWQAGGEKIFDQLQHNLDDVKKWISIGLALLSILAPRLISAAASSEVDQIIETLRTLQF